MKPARERLSDARLRDCAAFHVTGRCHVDHRQAASEAAIYRRALRKVKKHNKALCDGRDDYDYMTTALIVAIALGAKKGEK